MKDLLKLLEEFGTWDGGTIFGFAVISTLLGLVSCLGVLILSNTAKYSVCIVVEQKHEVCKR